MKRLLIVFVAFIGFSAQVAQAYIYSFSNHTDYPLRIKVQLHGASEPWEEIELTPRGTKNHYGEFKWAAVGTPGTMNGWKVGFCLQNLHMQTPYLVPQNKIDDDGNVKVTYVQGIDTSGNRKWNPERNVIPVPVNNEAYNAIISAGNAFADGAVEIAAAVASGVTGVPVPAFKVSGMTNAIGDWSKYSWCHDRHFDIIEDGDYSTKTDKSFVFLVEARG